MSFTILSLQGSKAAVLNMTEALAMELHPFGIHVTSIIPGYVKSDIIQNSLTETERYLQDPCSEMSALLGRFAQENGMLSLSH